MPSVPRVSAGDPPDPIRSTSLADGPWQELAIELMGPLPSGHSLLVIVNYYSRFYEFEVMQSTTTERIIDCLADTFCRHGLPNTIRSDNGPQFKSNELREYCKQHSMLIREFLPSGHRPRERWRDRISHC